MGFTVDMLLKKSLVLKKMTEVKIKMSPIHYFSNFEAEKEITEVSETET